MPKAWVKRRFCPRGSPKASRRGVHFGGAGRRVPPRLDSGAVIVAVAVVHVVQVAVDDVVDVVLVADGLVAAIRRVNVARLVTLANVNAVLVGAHGCSYAPRT